MVSCEDVWVEVSLFVCMAVIQCSCQIIFCGIICSNCIPFKHWFFTCCLLLLHSSWILSCHCLHTTQWNRRMHTCMCTALKLVVHACTCAHTHTHTHKQTNKPFVVNMLWVYKETNIFHAQTNSTTNGFASLSFTFICTTVIISLWMIWSHDIVLVFQSWMTGRDRNWMSLFIKGECCIILLADLVKERKELNSVFRLLIEWDLKVVGIIRVNRYLWISYATWCTHWRGLYILFILGLCPFVHGVHGLYFSDNNMFSICPSVVCPSICGVLTRPSHFLTSGWAFVVHCLRTRAISSNDGS